MPVTESVTLMVKSLKAGDEAISRVSLKVRVKLAPLTEAALSCGGMLSSDHWARVTGTMTAEPVRRAISTASGNIGRSRVLGDGAGRLSPLGPGEPEKNGKGGGGGYDRPATADRVKKWDAGEADYRNGSVAGIGYWKFGERGDSQRLAKFLNGASCFRPAFRRNPMLCKLYYQPLTLPGKVSSQIGVPTVNWCSHGHNEALKLRSGMGQVAQLLI